MQCTGSHRHFQANHLYSAYEDVRRRLQEDSLVLAPTSGGLGAEALSREVWWKSAE